MVASSISTEINQFPVDYIRCVFFYDCVFRTRLVFSLPLSLPDRSLCCSNVMRLIQFDTNCEKGCSFTLCKFILLKSNTLPSRWEKQKQQWEMAVQFSSIRSKTQSGKKLRAHQNGYHVDICFCSKQDYNPAQHKTITKNGSKKNPILPPLGCFESQLHKSKIILLPLARCCFFCRAQFTNATPFNCNLRSKAQMETTLQKQRDHILLTIFVCIIHSSIYL